MRWWFAEKLLPTQVAARGDRGTESSYLQVTVVEEEGVAIAEFKPATKRHRTARTIAFENGFHARKG